MSEGKPFEGIYAALPTPFDDAGRVDQKALDHLVDYLASRDIAGLALLTEAAEDPLLTTDERRGIITSVSARLKGRKPFIVALSAPSTRDAADLAKLVHSQSGDGILLTTYRLPGMNYRELYRHVEKLGKATDLPLMLMLRQENAFDSLAPEELSTLSKHGALRGVCVPSAPGSVIEHWTKRFTERKGSVMTGCALAFNGAAKAGADGVICGISVIASAQASKLADAIKRGHNEVVARLEKIFAPAVELLGPPRSAENMDSVHRLAAKLAKRPIDGFQLQPVVPFALIKEALRLQGHPVKNRVRPPYEQVSTEASDRLRSVLKLAEIIS